MLYNKHILTLGGGGLLEGGGLISCFDSKRGAYWRGGLNRENTACMHSFSSFTLQQEFLKAWQLHVT